MGKLCFSNQEWNCLQNRLNSVVESPSVNGFKCKLVHYLRCIREFKYVALNYFIRRGSLTSGLPEVMIQRVISISLRHILALSK